MTSGRRSVYKLFLAILVVFSFSELANASLLRGRLIYSNGVPAGGFAVTVYNQALGRSVPVFTDPTGMYYVNIPAGPYTLEIWVSRDPRVQPMNFSIQVVEPNTDIPPIHVN
ncbi:MAG: carboxypeptidase-like regulatory domain-containing protein [Candidatus Sulfotelmatobacter sp.]